MQERPDACLVNLPCGCSNPGKELKCEDCSHLEACLSRCKSIQVSNSHKKICCSKNIYP